MKQFQYYTNNETVLSGFIGFCKTFTTKIWNKKVYFLVLFFTNMSHVVKQRHLVLVQRKCSKDVRSRLSASHLFEWRRRLCRRRTRPCRRTGTLPGENENPEKPGSISAFCIPLLLKAFFSNGSQKWAFTCREEDPWQGALPEPQQLNDVVEMRYSRETKKNFIYHFVEKFHNFQFNFKKRRTNKHACLTTFIYICICLTRAL